VSSPNVRGKNQARYLGQDFGTGTRGDAKADRHIFGPFWGQGFGTPEALISDLPNFVPKLTLYGTLAGGQVELVAWSVLCGRRDRQLRRGARVVQNKSAMPQPALGKLTTINIRDLWEKEERDFTPWLAENIDQLSELLGIPISVEKNEKRVGRYELDIFGRGGLDKAKIVIIENQLEPTDHTHLGQLLTYAAGLDAAIIVWVAPEVRDEHRRAIEWLNDKTVNEISFFLVRPEALSINNSPPAVRLNLEAGPNGFVDGLGDGKHPESPWQKFLRTFWGDLYPYLAAHGHSWAQGRSATSEKAIYSTVGKAGVYVYVSLNRAQSRAFVSIWLESDLAKEQFDALVGNKATIEAEFSGQRLSWDRADDRVASSVYVERPYDKDKISEATTEREALFSWIAENLTKFRNIAKKYLVEKHTV
jgi:hypothetical protein